MICPNCGNQLPDHATRCSVCNHRFTFGYGNRLPSDSPIMMTGSGKKAKRAQRVLASIFLMIFLIIIISLILSIFFNK